MPVITISRQFGSGGSEVAARVAESLGWTLLDNAFVEKVAQGLHATPAHVQAIEERVPSLAERIADAFAFGASEIVSAPMHTPLPPTEERLLEVTRHVIHEAVARGPVVLVGRGAQASLASRADAIHALCCAPEDALVARVQARDGTAADEARHRVREMNRRRETYVRRYWHRNWLAATNYDLCLNTSSLGIDGASDAIVRAARARGW
ncbi:MAG: Cytidylate kinase [Gemmatimonadaceae bacterium]|nr:Cytidylate kinase [Gemmatimonadaceae bacterium]